jgi:hypothetical protein
VSERWRSDRSREKNGRATVPHRLGGTHAHERTCARVGEERVLTDEKKMSVPDRRTESRAVPVSSSFTRACNVAFCCLNAAISASLSAALIATDGAAPTSQECPRSLCCSVC